MERPIFETFVRGVWLWHCASEKDVEKFKKDEIDRKFGYLIAEIEKSPIYDRLILSKFKSEGWRPMCSYAHVGYLQVGRRILQGAIRPRYTEGEKMELINSSRAFAQLAAYEIFSMANRDDLMKEMLERMR